MTMLDDDRLASVLADAARRFDVPANGPAAILARARGVGSESLSEDDGDSHRSDGVEGEPIRITRLRRAVGAAQRHRLASVAACFVVLLVTLGTVGVLARPASSPSTSSLAPRSAAHAPAANGSPTTLPAFSSGSAAPRTQLPTPASSSATSSASGSAPLSTQSQSGATSGALSGPQLPNGAVGRSSRIEQSGTLSLTVRSGRVSRTVSALSALAGANGGFVASSQTNSGANSAPGGSVTLEVPVDSFATVLKEAEALGRPSGVSTKATDVTGQYVDLQARIGALQSSRQQYLTILARATTIGDVLSVQEQIDTIQSQIEQLQGQLQVLTNETAYSTLTATVNQTSTPPPPSPVPESGLVQAWHQSVSGFVDGVEGVVRLTGPALFILVCLAGVLVGGRVLWRRYRRHSL
jgi:Domain of unknown function (DUF4349)